MIEIEARISFIGWFYLEMQNYRHIFPQRFHPLKYKQGTKVHTGLGENIPYLLQHILFYAHLLFVVPL